MLFGAAEIAALFSFSSIVINNETTLKERMKDKVIFSVIPHFSNYVVSNDGNLFKRTVDGNLKQMANALNYDGYVCNHITDDDGKRRYM